MPSLRELMLQKQREEEARAKVVQEKRAREPVPRGTKSPISKPVDIPPVEIPIDALRGLYWMATPDHVGDKKATRGQMKRKVNDTLLTKEGMRTFLQSLEKFVFS